MLDRLVEAGDTHTVVLARNAEQVEAIESLDLPRVTVPRHAVDGRSLVAMADLLVSAGGTMNREAAVLGTPAVSIFEGRLGAVDEMLIAQGRLELLSDPEADRDPKTATRGVAAQRQARSGPAPSHGPAVDQRWAVSARSSASSLSSSFSSDPSTAGTKRPSPIACRWRALTISSV